MIVFFVLYIRYEFVEKSRMVGILQVRILLRKKERKEKILQRIRFEWQRDGNIFIGNMNI